MVELIHHVRRILTPELCLATYRLRFPFVKGAALNGAAVGQMVFKPSPEYIQAFYDMIFRSAIIHLSRLPLNSLLSVDLTQLLPLPTAPDYPEQCLGLITILDQQRIVQTGYGQRYLRAFFDPVCEKLARQLTAQPAQFRPDGKAAWLSRGYSIDDWLIRTLWFWAPLVHSDVFMTADRQSLKDWLHAMRAETETHCGYADPFAPLEAVDDVDVTAFQRIEEAGPPVKSYANSSKEATVADYTFWWIRILNSHFAITDMCGHYPYWIRWAGLEWTLRDKAFMEQTNNYRYDPEDEPVLQLVRKDYLEGVWRALGVNPEYERGS